MLLSLAANGQGSFRAGYVITLQQDTIYGLIDYKIARKSALKCRFKPSRQANEVVYTPTDIAGYRFTPGKYYVARTVEKDGEAKTLFLEYLIDGIADVFFYRDNHEDHYYLEPEGEELQPLAIDEIATKRGNKHYILRKEKYKGVLKSAFSDAPALSDDIDGLKLTHLALIDIAEAYHDQVCDDYACVTYSRVKSPLQVRVGLLIGNDISRLSFSEAEYLRGRLEAPFSASQSLTFGGFVRMKDPFVSERKTVASGGGALQQAGVQNG